jgi:predicted ATPase
MVLNEPETSLHPDLLPPLARLIAAASRHTQVIVVSHAPPLVAALQQVAGCRHLNLEKSFGETILSADSTEDPRLRRPRWQWPSR